MERNPCLQSKWCSYIKFGNHHVICKTTKLKNDRQIFGYTVVSYAVLHYCSDYCSDYCSSIIDQLNCVSSTIMQLATVKISRQKIQILY